MTFPITKNIRGIAVMTDFAIASVASIVDSEESPFRTIVLFSCIGLVASLCMMSLGIDIGTGWV
jgi:hypothetical protein